MQFTHIQVPQITVSGTNRSQNKSKAVKNIGIKKAAKPLTLGILVACMMILTAFVNVEHGPAHHMTVKIFDGENTDEFSTEFSSADEIIAERRVSLHPFDMITYAGFAQDGTFFIKIKKAPLVTIECGGESRQAYAVIGETVSELLSRERYELGENDFISLPLDSKLSEDCTLTVTRAFPVKLTADGKTSEVYAAGITVGELLEREGVVLSEDDELSCEADTEIFPEEEITVRRVTFTKETEEQTVPFDTENVDTPLLAMGESRVAVSGENGAIITERTYKYVDGELEGSFVSGMEKVLPVNEVVEHGTAFTEPYSKREGDYTLKDGIPTEYEKVISGKVTAYTAKEGCGTYSGRPLVIGSVGVDPNVIPFGSELYIVSQDHTKVYGYAVASDTGDITDIIADAYMGTQYEDALWWCAQYCDVYVLKTGDNTVSWRDGVSFD